MPADAPVSAVDVLRRLLKSLLPVLWLSDFLSDFDTPFADPGPVTFIAGNPLEDKCLSFYYDDYCWKEQVL
jgi:hypothetical protein